MIDKLELLVPGGVPKRHNEWQKYPVKPAKIGLPYLFTLDADHIKVHYGHRLPIPKEKRHFRVEFVHTRVLCAEDLLWGLKSLFQIDQEEAMSLPVARIDFAVDVFDVPVEWFNRNCRVKGKKKVRSYEGQKKEASTGALRSLQFGSNHSDLYRIYDRISEGLGRRVEELLEWKRSAYPLPIITRVERQCCGSGVPDNLKTLGGVFKQASEADPFPKLECTQTGSDPIAVESWTPQQWLMNVGLAAVVKELGLATVRARLNRTGGGNAKRIFDKYSDLLRSDSPGVSADFLRERYRKRTIRQLNLPIRGPDGKIRYPMGGRTLTL